MPTSHQTPLRRMIAATLLAAAGAVTGFAVAAPASADKNPPTASSPSPQPKTGPITGRPQTLTFKIH
jgi:hypothetical protein